MQSLQPKREKHCAFLITRILVHIHLHTGHFTGTVPLPHLVEERRKRVSGDGQFDGRLPDLRVFAPLSRHHELDGLGQVRHVLLRVQRSIRTNADFGVAALEADPLTQMASLELD